MISEIHSDLIRGHINTFILKALFESDRYGYDICRDIEERSNGQYKLKQPTLYSCLRRLESQGYITSYWGGANALGGRRKYYTLTSQGRDLFVKNQTEWEYSRTVIDKLISEKIFDISSLPPVAEKFRKSPSDVIDSVAQDDGDTYFDDESFLEEAETTEDEVESVPVSDTQEYMDGYSEDVRQSEAAAAVANGVNEPEAIESDSIDEQSVPELVEINDDIEDIEIEDVEDDIEKEEQIFSETSEIYDDTTDAEPIHEFKYFDLSDKATSPTAIFGGSYTGSVDNETIRIKEYQPKSFFRFSEDDYADDSDSYFKATTAPVEEVSEPIPDEPQDSGTRIENKYIQPDDFESIDAIPKMFDTFSLYHEETDEELTERILKEYRNNSGFEHKDEVKTIPSEENLARNYIDKEYQNLIGKIFGDADYYTAASTAPDNVTKIVKKNYSRLNNFDDASASSLSEKKYYSPAHAQKPDDKEVKKHTKELSENFSSSYYYYSNRLRLTHYGILFLIMALETAAVFLVLDLVMKTNQVNSALYYIFALVIAAAMPVAAILPHINKPNFKKRYTFSLADSAIVRMLIFVNVLLVILSINLFGFRVTLTNVNDYLVTIVLPCVLATNIPVSGIVFQLLYNTKKYAA